MNKANELLKGFLEHGQTQRPTTDRGPTEARLTTWNTAQRCQFGSWPLAVSQLMGPLRLAVRLTGHTLINHLDIGIPGDKNRPQFVSEAVSSLLSLLPTWATSATVKAIFITKLHESESSVNKDVFLFRDRCGSDSTNTGCNLNGSERREKSFSFQPDFKAASQTTTSGCFCNKMIALGGVLLQRQCLHLKSFKASGEITVVKSSRLWMKRLRLPFAAEG